MKIMIARILVTLVCIVNLVGAPLADYNKTHIFNPLWPPHARFHDGQTISLSVALGLTALFFCWNKKNSQNLAVAILIASLYWITQACAGFFPGAAYIDPEFVAETPLLFGTIPPQVVLDVVLLTSLSIAFILQKQTQK